MGRETRFVEGAGGVELAVDVWTEAGVAAGPGVGAGAAPPFVLVHGLASNARLWDGVVDALTALGHPVATVDQRGHGRSGRPDSGYDFATVVADLVAVIGALGWDRPVVVGQSWGGNVVVELGARAPSLVRGIATVDGGVREFRRWFPAWEACEQALAPPRLEGTPLATIEASLRRAHPDWPEAGIAGALANFEVRADGTVAPWLTFDRHMQVVRSLWEWRVPALPPDLPALFIMAGDVELSVPHGTLVRIDGDHDLHAQYPEQVASLLHGFFR